MAKSHKLQNIDDAATIGEAYEKIMSSYNPEVHALAGVALGKYCSAFLALWPWTASGLIMTAAVAFGSGLAQM